ncbi:VOC family protein [Actinomadura sp. WMMB 499]|uniref:VOC family protein n=1 Tax=Actinomadura sp. WMMB 499 TaxID=1219491 RepID=UPI001245B220|nr:VOC family protein [Actinomadura sp. WMMB 499]QFG22636.1 VOC family protein [Actinomadura sp. WMMB 499]
MSILLDHIIVPSTNKRESAEFLAGVLGLEAGAQTGPFVPVRTGNGVTLDFMDSSDFRWQHCAFLVPDEEFDAIFARIKESGTRYYANPDKSGEGQINTRDGGRGVYFDDPSGHAMEILTVPYGGWS